ncbi:U11 U12 small nuclear ribonucleo 35 kDa [Brachionus plicatilis]|uniref:U11/U12 small nuclear ribonucleoprotein 35 kDa protein n=1 Tax=Brachionus plicatilis TaxID=10195 RepID=A0A3M7QLF7_BRAPC|nr:U11 U12 small nuclear ribonucleo 35 kDa [Brachionus plicatilis]
MSVEKDDKNRIGDKKSDKFSFEDHLKRRQVAIDKNYEYTRDYEFYDPIICGSIDGTDEKPHDHGIVRAISSRYVPNKGVNTNSTRTLFVAGLNFQTNEEALKKYFSKFGKIKKLRLVRDIITGFSRGYAFIEYKHKSDMCKAYHESFKANIDGRELIVEYELERKLKGWRPRRLGGGLGGFKESGQLRFGGRYKPFAKIFKTKLYQLKKRQNF